MCAGSLGSLRGFLVASLAVLVEVAFGWFLEFPPEAGNKTFISVFQGSRGLDGFQGPSGPRGPKVTHVFLMVMSRSSLKQHRQRR